MSFAIPYVADDLRWRHRSFASFEIEIAQFSGSRFRSVSTSSVAVEHGDIPPTGHVSSFGNYQRPHVDQRGVFHKDVNMPCL
jgi:hypothetical protein